MRLGGQVRGDACKKIFGVVVKGEKNEEMKKKLKKKTKQNKKTLKDLNVWRCRPLGIDNLSHYYRSW